MYAFRPYSKRTLRPVQSAAIKWNCYTLRIPAALPEKNKDHQLTGNYSGYRECHIEPDWLLVYKQTPGELQLYRTGTHSDLFKK